VQTTGNLAKLTSGGGDWFIFLERGKPTSPDKDAVAKMHAGHVANFGRLFVEQKLFAAGPLADPSGITRGMVVVKAPNREILQRYFDAEDFMREGYMTLNARRAVVNKPLNTEGIDAKSVEEVRIILVGRPSIVLDADTESNAKAFLQTLVKVASWEPGTALKMARCPRYCSPASRTRSDSKRLDVIRRSRPWVRTSRSGGSA